MPFTPEQLTSGTDYTLKSYERSKPVDQINVNHVLLDWLIKNKKESNFGNGSFKQPLYTTNNGNYQNYWGADQVTYNERDPVDWTDFTWYNNHDGFWFDEDRLAANGIIMTDDRNAVASGVEKEQLVNLLDTSYDTLKKSIQESMAYEMYRTGATAKSCPGLQHIVQKLAVDWATNGNTVGGIASATVSYFRNVVNTAFTPADVVEEMEQSWRDVMRYGGVTPNLILCGSAFLDNYRIQAGTTINREISAAGNQRGGVSLDAGTTGLFFKGVELKWDPTLDAVGTADSDATLTKTCYFLHSDKIVLRPLRGHWMVNRKPERLPDRYVHYFAKTSKYGLTTDQRNALAVLSIS